MTERRDSAVWSATRRLGRPARPLYYYLVGRRHVLPDYLVIGAMKAGTSSLHAYLSEHPQVMAWPRKEIHYFDREYGRGSYWYRRNFPTRRAVAERRASLGRSVAVGETTPCYLFHPAVAARVHRLLPEARLIVLLRDPVTRAFSHYRQLVRRGLESLSFAAALDAEDERLAGAEQALASGPIGHDEAHVHYSYRARGRYLEQLQRYFELVPAERILVLKSEEMFRDPQATLDQAFAFLGLDPWRLVDASVRNQGPEDAGPIPCEAMLRAYFEPHNRRLCEFLGRDMSW